MSQSTSYFEVKPGYVERKVTIPSSKSRSTRLLILGSMTRNDFVIQNISRSSDVTNLIECIRKIGIKISYRKNEICISDSFPECEKKTERKIRLWPGNGGATNRFFIPMLARGVMEYEINLDPQFGKRPMQELYDGLCELGVSILFCKENKSDRFLLNGPYRNIQKKINIDSSKSSQFVSGIAMSLYDKDIEVVPEGMETSFGYWEMTRMLISDVKSGKQKFTVPTDMSSLSYPLALGITNGRVEIMDFRNDVLQPDSVILDIVNAMGADVCLNDGRIFAESKKKLNAFDIDCSDHPDLIPTLVYLAVHASGKSCLKSLKVLKYKESNRLDEIQKILNLFKVQYSYDLHSDELIITASDRILPNVDYHAPSDHRMIMMAWLFMKKNSGGRIYNFHHVNKSYPDFFKEMED